MKIALSLLTVLSVALLAQGSALSAEHEWAAFKAQYGRIFSDIDSRKADFLDAKARIEKHNAEADQGIHTYYKKINAMSIMTDAERSGFFGAIVPTEKDANMETHVSSGVGAPVSLDLRTHQCMPAIKNQAPCGNCYAFGATNPIEYQLCIKNRALTILSEQQITDCSHAYNNNGCHGGFMNNVWRYLQDAGGQQAEASYPLRREKEAGTCVFNKNKVVVKVARYVQIPAGPNAVNDIKEALSTYGPVSVAIDANKDWSDWTSTKGGYFSGPCSKTVNHAVIIVGYGSVAGTPVWYVRNQWGTGYGLAGYWIMRQGVDQCAIETYAMYPVIA